MRALILSAGLGERLRPLTLTRAKPAVEFLNMPMLAFPYYWLNTLSLSDVVFNTHYLPETIRHAAMHVVDPNKHLHFTHEDAILGSGGGIWNARFHLQWDQTFAVANGDGVVTFQDSDTLEQMYRFHKDKKALATLLTCPLEGVGSKIPGVWLDKYGEVTNFGKTPKKDYLECLHYASFMLFDEKIWKLLPEGSSNILYDVLEPAISDGAKVYGYRVDQMHWFETGNVQDYLSATAQCLEYLRLNNRYGQRLNEMLTKLAPMFEERTDFSKRLLIADSAEIANTTSFEGFSVVGENVKIGANVEIENCVILSGAEIAPGSKHKNSVIS